MVNLYTYRNTLEKDAFLYHHLKKKLKTQEKVIVLVPEQATMERERSLIKGLNLKGLMDVQVMSFTRLAHLILFEEGGIDKPFIDDSGKQILLSRILLENNKSLNIYKNIANRPAFVQLIFKSFQKFRQYGVTPEMLSATSAELEKSFLLKLKMEDISLLYGQFISQLEGKFTDNEIYLDLIIKKVKQSKRVAETTFWIDQFHTFSAKDLKILGELMAVSLEFNGLFLSSHHNKEVFKVTDYAIENLMKMTQENGINCKLYDLCALHQIFEKKGLPISRDLKPDHVHLEQRLYQYPIKAYQKPVSYVHLKRCSNFYTEFATVAYEINKLVREKGYAYRDIGIICGELESKKYVIKNILKEYDVPYFIDGKRTINENPFVIYIVSLLRMVVNHYAYEDVFDFFKTGLSFLSRGEYEQLENYCLKYKIRGHLWKNPFRRKNSEGVEAIRKRFIDYIEPLENALKNEQSVKGKTNAFCQFLKETLKIEEKIEWKILEFQKNGALEEAKETEQVWEVTLSLFNQCMELLGDVPISNKGFLQAIEEGFSSVDISIIPTTQDQVVVGDIGRTRFSRLKALFITSLNNGILPKAFIENELFSEGELETLSEKGLEAGKTSTFKNDEERLFIYDSFTKAEEYLFLSYSLFDINGDAIKESSLIHQIKQLFPLIEVGCDIENHKDIRKRILNPISTRNYLIRGLRDLLEDENPNLNWVYVLNWYLEKNHLNAFKGFLHENKIPEIGAPYREQVFPNPLTLSVSRLEKYAQCPFAYFMEHIIKAEERKLYEVTPLETGTLNHQVLEIFIKEMMEKDISWDTLTQEACTSIMEPIVQKVSDVFKEGLFQNEAQNIYRLERIKDEILNTGWALAKHIQKGKFRTFYLEEVFDIGKPFKPIELELEGNKSVRLHGTIDRIDVIREENNLFIKIIDYKTGKDVFNVEDVKKGLKLQLMTYLIAAINHFKQESKTVVPVGVFNAIIQSPMIETETENQQSIALETEKMYRLKGVVSDVLEHIHLMDQDLVQGSSTVIPVILKKDGTPDQKSSVISEGEWENLMETTKSHIKNLSNQILKGNIDAFPVKKKNSQSGALSVPCSYCAYKSLCLFEPGIQGCFYRKP